MDVLHRPDAFASRRVQGCAILPPGTMCQVHVDGVPVCIARAVAGQFFAIDDTCSHGKASLSQGWLNGREVACPKHAGVFDLETGEALAAPATIALQAYEIEVDGDDLILSRKRSV